MRVLFVKPLGGSVCLPVNRKGILSEKGVQDLHFNLAIPVDVRLLGEDSVQTSAFSCCWVSKHSVDQDRAVGCTTSVTLEWLEDKGC